MVPKVIALILISTCASKEVLFRESCDVKDTQCLSRSLEEFLSKSYKGLPENGIFATDPVIIPELDVEMVEDSRLIFKHRNVSVTGLRNLKITDLRIDPRSKSVILIIRADLHINGDLILEYNNRSLSFSGSFTYRTSTLITDVYNYDIESDRNGIEHMEFGTEKNVFYEFDSIEVVYSQMLQKALFNADACVDVNKIPLKTLASTKTNNTRRQLNNIFSEKPTNKSASEHSNNLPISNKSDIDDQIWSDEEREVISLYQQGYKVLVLMRGPPGSGKSTLARKIIEYLHDTRKETLRAHIISADDFYTCRGEYKYNQDRNYLAHAWCAKIAKDAVNRRVNPVIIDNTNIYIQGTKLYVKAAVDNGYIVKVLEPKTPWAKNADQLKDKNVHNVPISVISNFMKTFLSVTGEDLIKCFGLNYTAAIEATIPTVSLHSKNMSGSDQFRNDSTMNTLSPKINNSARRASHTVIEKDNTIDDCPRENFVNDKNGTDAVHAMKTHIEEMNKRAARKILAEAFKLVTHNIQVSSQGQRETS